MRVEPEQVLEQDRIAAARGIENPEVECPLQNHQNQSDGDDRGSEQHNDAGSVVRPHKQWQARPGHSWRAHAMDSHDEVQSGENRRESRNENCQTGFNYSRVTELRRERRIEGPASVHAAGYQAMNVENA